MKQRNKISIVWRTKKFLVTDCSSAGNGEGNFWCSMDERVKTSREEIPRPMRLL